MLEVVVRRMLDAKTNTLIVIDAEGKYFGIVIAKHLIMAVLSDFLEDRQILGYMKVAFLLMLLLLAISSVYLWLRFFTFYT